MFSIQIFSKMHGYCANKTQSKKWILADMENNTFLSYISYNKSEITVFSSKCNIKDIVESRLNFHLSYLQMLMWITFLWKQTRKQKTHWSMNYMKIVNHSSTYIFLKYFAYKYNLGIICIFLFRVWNRWQCMDRS